MSSTNRSRLEASFSEVQNDLSSRKLYLIIVESLVLASISLIAVFGNMVVLIAFYRCSRLRTAVNLLVISLASCDLFTALVVVPISTGVLATGKMFMGPVACQMFGSLSYLLENLTFHTMCLIAVNRVLLMVKPSWYNVLFNFKATMMTVISSWVFQLLYAILPALADWSEPFLSPGYTTCSLLVTHPLAKQFYRTQKEAVMIGGIFIITMCYIVVYIKIKRRKNCSSPSVEPTEVNKKEENSQYADVPQGHERISDDSIESCSANPLRYLDHDPLYSDLSQDPRKQIITRQQSDQFATLDNRQDAIRSDLSQDSRELSPEQNDQPTTPDNRQRAIRSDLSQDSRKLSPEQNGQLTTPDNRQGAIRCDLSQDSRKLSQQNDQPVTTDNRQDIIQNYTKLSTTYQHHDNVVYLGQLKTTKVLFFSTLFFMVSWIPLSIMLIVESYQARYVSRQVELFGMTLLFLGTTFNPIILAILSRDFRVQFYKILGIKNNVVQETPH